MHAFGTLLIITLFKQNDYMILLLLLYLYLLLRNINHSYMLRDECENNIIL